jgi:hypothetical protein
MDFTTRDATQKPATAARMYDYYLGGIHNFPADQQAARKVVEQLPFIPAAIRSGRAFLRRAVRHLAEAGVRQFLDVGSGIPTVGNVHEIAQERLPDARVVYVDIDPVAVAEGLEILEANELATAIHGDLRRPEAILENPELRRLLDFDRPIGLLLIAMLHFMPDDEQAYGAVARLVDALAPGSYLVVSHAAAEAFDDMGGHSRIAGEIYRKQTATPGVARTRSGVERFFAGLELVDPGVAGLHEWRPDGSPVEPEALVGEARRSAGWAGVGRKP